MNRLPFLKRVAHYYYELYQDDITNYCFIFPSKRSLTFFQNYLQEELKQVIFSPKLETINNFICDQYSELKVLDETALLFELYKSYTIVRKEFKREVGSFEDFLFWGRMIIKDFDQIDRYLIEAEDLFTNIAEYRDLDDHFDYLSEESRQLIQDFWKGFHLREGESQNQGVENFIHFWEELPRLYKHFNTSLREQKACYEGAIYRLVAEDKERVVDALVEQKSSKKYIFVGLFGLAKAERVFLKALKNEGLAEFVWDEDVELLKDHKNPVSRLLNQDKDYLGQVSDFFIDMEKSYLPKEVELIQSVSAIAQAKALPIILEEIKTKDEKSEQKLNKAIILPNERLLLPVVSSIPDDFGTLNISMGYPLSGTPIAIMINKWKALLLINRDGSYYPADKLSSLLSSELFSEFVPQLGSLLDYLYNETKFYYTASELIEYCSSESFQCLKSELFLLANKVFDDDLSNDDIKAFSEGEAGDNDELEVKRAILQNSIIYCLFEPKLKAEDFLQTLIILLRSIYTLSALQKEAPLEDLSEIMLSETSSAKFELSDFDEEFIYHYIRIAKRLQTLIELYWDSLGALSVKSCVNLLERLVYNVKIPFEGDPLDGLQLLGLLESRTLNFEYLIYLSASEGSLPKMSHQSSLIPYSLQVGFGLPTREEQDAISAYQFYQTIAKTKQLVLFCGEDDSRGGKGDSSRYIKQLRYQYNLPIKERIIQLKPYKEEAVEEVIDKEQIKDKLQPYLNGEKSLSISKLLVYARCPLSFYYETIEGVNENQLPDVLSSPKVFGDILHNTMEKIYEPYIGQIVPKSYILGLINEKGHQRIKAIILKNEYYQKRSKQKSYWKDLELETLVNNAVNILRFDAQSTFTYLGSEIKMSLSLPIETAEGTKNINFVGYIDRCDLLEESDGSQKLRVLDYKTGKDKLVPIDMDNDFYSKVLRHKDGDTKAIVQTLFYCLMIQAGSIVPNQNKQEALSTYLEDLRANRLNLYPGLLLTREISKSADKFYPIIKSKKGGDLYFSEEVSAILVEALTQLLEEIFDYTIPFTARNEGKSCQYCLHNK